MSGSVIRVLPENLANKIAAGEVVERPASIIKELVENAIDARTDEVVIELENGGKRSIRVMDNGSGMNRDDALLAFERHATSKIRKDSDLQEISTLGFRGEALPSVASVSKISMTTSTGENGNGMQLRLEGGVVREVREAAHPRGTSLQVSQLFFNTPARKKFLKSDQTELGHISSLIIRQAIARPGISFKVSHNGRNLIHTPGHSELLPRLMDLFGRDMIRELIPLQNSNNGLKLTGYISKPGYSRSGKDSLYYFINKRHVKDKLITHAAMEAYRTLLPKGKMPVLFLFLKIDPGAVDVNVHPSKTEVRFSQPDRIHHFIRDSLCQGLQSVEKPTYAIPAYAPAGVSESPHAIKEIDVRASVEPPLEKNELQRQVFFEPHGKPVNGNRVKKGPDARGEETACAFSSGETLQPTALNVSSIDYEDFSPLGQIDNSYIVLEGPHGMILIDQHAAHERILYERFLAQKEKRSMEPQQLLFPITLELNRAEMLFMEPLLENLNSLGFDCEPFGGNSLLIRSAPSLLSGGDVKTLVRDICDKATDGNKKMDFEELGGNIIAVMACHAAVRAGEPLKGDEINSLISELKVTGRPCTCPHGRPIALLFDMGQIKKYFLR